MTYKIYDLSDDIIKVGFIGDVGKEFIDAYHAEILDILKNYTETDRLSFHVDCSQEGHQSMYARRVLTQLNNDRRIKKIALVKARPVTRVVGTFIMRATGRENIRFFDDEQIARDWLQKE